MATPPLGMMMQPPFDGNPMAAAAARQPPAIDMTGICFRDQLWLNMYPLDRNLVFDYFAHSPFYDSTCNNEKLRSRSTHPLDMSHLSKLPGVEYVLSEVLEPNLFVIRKQKRDGPDKVTHMLTYYVLDGSIYQAPQLSSVFAARIKSKPLLILDCFIVSTGLSSSDGATGRALYHISKAFTTAASKLEKIGYVDGEDESSASDSKVTKETIDIKEVKRIDQILASLQRRLPPTPPPPPFPEGYTPPTKEAEKSAETPQAADSPPSIDPIIDQGPAKRMKF